MRKQTKIDFIEKAVLVHGDKYNYSLVEYINNKTKVKIICSEHGEFEQTPNCHLSGQGCPKCGKDSFVVNKKLTNNKFIEKAVLVHGNKYNYSLVNYLSYENNITIICPIHGEFEQTPHSHINGSGCQKCGNVSPKSLDEIVKLSKDKHGSKYDYSLVNYVNAKTKIKIICPIHGEFEQNVIHHLNGQGCPICKESKGEREIRDFLTNKNIDFIKQKRFPDCKDIRPLPFDFYLPDLNICIEYDGIQHYKPVSRFGGLKSFELIKKRDKIKNNYCLINKIKLVRFSYQYNINEKLNELFSN
jgi:hypothetical protein